MQSQAQIDENTGTRMASPDKLKCLKCGHEWYQRTPEKPATCANPKCRSVTWDKPPSSRPKRIGKSKGGRPKKIVETVSAAEVDQSLLRVHSEIAALTEAVTLLIREIREDRKSRQ